MIALNDKPVSLHVFVNLDNYSRLSVVTPEIPDSPPKEKS